MALFDYVKYFNPNISIYTCLTLLVTVTIFTLELYNFLKSFSYKITFFINSVKKQGWPYFFHSPEKVMKTMKEGSPCHSKDQG